MKAALAIVLCLLGLASVEAQRLNFKPYTSFQVIETGHFEFIFPPESRPTAERLAGSAEALYEQVSALLGIRLKRRVPVAITPHTELFNAYMRGAPYPHIVLFDTPADPDSFTAFENNLESVFLHELTHAVSLSSRNRFMDAIYDIIGPWLNPTDYTSPLFMTEGVSVAVESSGGFGRANDPLFKQTLRQAVLDNAFLMPFQASGVYDFPPNGVWYEYGGLFSTWLIDQYGWDRYRELWRRMGSEYHFSFSFYKNGFFYSFSQVYETPFMEAWEAFRESLRLSGVEDNAGGIVYTGESLISGVDSAAGRVYALDRVAGSLIAFEPERGARRTQTLISTDSYALDISGDGEYALISSYLHTEDLAQAAVVEYRIEAGWPSGRSWTGLHQGQYFRDGVIGLGSDRHISKLVFRPPNGAEEVLVMGGERLVLGAPRAVDNDWIAFIAVRDGLRELCLYHYASKTAYTLAGDRGAGERLGSIRYLQTSGGRLFFGFNHDDRLYKLGAIDLRGLGPEPESVEALFSLRDFSGGASMVALLGEDLYYRASFSTWDALARYPEPLHRLSGERAALRFTAWTAPPWIGPENEPEPEPLPSKPYNMFAYVNPFHFWIAFPLINLGVYSGFSIDGISGLSLMMDPTDTNLITASVSLNIRDLIGEFSLRWQTLGFGFPLTFELSDDLNKNLQVPRRRTFAGVQAAVRGVFRFGATVSFVAETPFDGSNVYTWDYGEPVYTLTAGLDLNAVRKMRWHLFGNGLGLHTTFRYALPQGIPSGEARLRASAEFPGIRTSLYYAWSGGADLDLYGRALNHAEEYIGGSLFSDIAAQEYSTKAINRLSWLAGGECEVKLFNLHIQKHIDHEYFNNVYSTFAYRNVLYNADQTDHGPDDPALGQALAQYRLAQALVLRLGLTVSVILQTSQPWRASFVPWLAWRISDPAQWTRNLAFGISLIL